MAGLVERLSFAARRIVRGQLPWRRWPRHPFDLEHGIETSSHLRVARLKVGDAAVDENNVGYAGSQPSVVRAALERIPAPERRTVLDLGCGKGRVLAIASEYPFANIVGIEIVPALIESARANARIIASRYPARTPIAVRDADATDLSSFFGTGDLLLFLYNSFRAPLVERLIASIEAWASESPTGSLYLIYYNPVHFGLFDESPVFERFDAEKVRFSAEERAAGAFGNDSDSFVIYRLCGRDGAPKREGHSRNVVVTVPDLGAEVICDD